ncbi:hypothetical protein V1503_25060 [Bacillus sp. SCS-151]|uniref:hypothetical protein n=1 Tax=Nanhaiella sioensis TaxID=3115293 RepID=UPI00397D24FD
MIITANIKEFTKYSKFNSLKDFNNNIEMFLAEHKDEFTASEYLAFNRLRKFCAKVFGVANASKKKVLEAVQGRDDEVGISESTFHRMKRKAIKLGILSVESTQRNNGSQSTNLWIFNRVVSNSSTIDTPRTAREQEETASNQEQIVRQLTPLKTINNFKTNKHLNNIKDHLMSVRFKYLKYVPKNVNFLYANLFGQDLKFIWKRVIWACNAACKTFSDVTVDKKEREEIGLYALRTLEKYIKDRHYRNEGTLSLDEQCRLVYAVTFAQIEQQKASDESIFEEYDQEQIMKNERIQLFAQMLS